MDPILNEESITESQTEQRTEPTAEPRTEARTEPQTEPRSEVRTEPRPAPRRRKPRKKNTIRIPDFLIHLGEDVRWYYDIRLWSPLILLLFILALLPGKKEPKVLEETVPVVTVAETMPVENAAPTEEEIIPEAAALARLADSVGAGRSDNVKIAIMWVAINRSEDRANGYGQSLLEEISRPNQWQGYDEYINYGIGTYEMAKQVLDTQARGRLRPVDSDMLWFVLNDNGSITIRNQFTATANQKWREKTVK